MRIRLKLFWAFFLSSFLFLLLGYLFLLFNTRGFITRILRSVSGSDVTIDYFHVSPLFEVEMEGIKSGEFSVDKLSCRMNPFAFLGGTVYLHNLELSGVKLYYYKRPAAEGKGNSQAAQLDLGHSSGNIKIIIRKLVIKDSLINFIDKTALGDSINLKIVDFNFSADNLFSYSGKNPCEFFFTARIPWDKEDKNGQIEGKGWANFFKKDIEAQLKAEGINAIFFYPYYKQWVDLEKANVEKAKLNFFCQIEGANNAVSAKCRLELADISFKQHEEGEQPKMQEKLAQVVLDIFKGDNDKIVLDFTVYTTFDRPEFGFTNIKSAVEDQINRARLWERFRPPAVLEIPKTLLQGMFKGVNDLSKAAVSGTLGIGKAVGAVFNSSLKSSK